MLVSICSGFSGLQEKGLDFLQPFFLIVRLMVRHESLCPSVNISGKGRALPHNNQSRGFPPGSGVKSITD